MTLVYTQYTKRQLHLQIKVVKCDHTYLHTQFATADDFSVAGKR